MSGWTGRYSDAGAVEIVEKHVAVLGVLAIGLASPILQQNVTAHSHTGRERGCLPRMIGLSRAWAQHDIGALIARLRRRNSSFLVLLPPVDIPVQSSRLIQISGPLRWRVRLGRCSSGVGR